MTDFKNDEGVAVQEAPANESTGTEPVTIVESEDGSVVQPDAPTEHDVFELAPDLNSSNITGMYETTNGDHVELQAGANALGGYESKGYKFLGFTSGDARPTPLERIRPLNVARANVLAAERSLASAQESERLAKETETALPALPDASAEAPESQAKWNDQARRQDEWNALTVEQRAEWQNDQARWESSTSTPTPAKEAVVEDKAYPAGLGSMPEENTTGTPI